MKYWIFQSNQVLGPYGPEDLCGLATFSAESLVCPEGRRGTSMGDWLRAGMVADLSAALVKAAQSNRVQAPVLTLAGLPAEPTLKDLAVLGSLQEKTAMLEDAVLQLQESLRVKDAELSGLHQELAEKDKEAFELKRTVDAGKSESDASLKRADDLAAESELRRQEAEKLKSESEDLKRRIADMEERVGEVRRIGDALDKAVEAEKKVEHDVDAHGATLGDLARQVETLRAELQEKLAAPPHMMPSVLSSSPAPLPVPIASANVPFATAAHDLPNIAPPLASVPAVEAAFAPAPATAAPEPPAPAAPEAPAAAPVPAFGAHAPEAVPFGAAPGVVPLPTFGSSPSFDPLTPSAPAAVEAAPAPEPAPVDLVAPRKKPKPLLLIAVVGAGLAAGAVMLSGRMRRAAPPAPEPAPLPAPAVTPAPAAPKSAASMSAPAGNPDEGGPVEGGPVAGAPAVDPGAAAISAAQDWKLADGRTLGAALETLSPPSGNLSPWMASPESSGDFLVNYFAQGGPGAPTVAYEFEVDAADKTVAARNAAAKAVLQGKAIEPPAPPKRPVHLKVRPKSRAAHKPKRAPAKHVESLDNLLGAPGASAPAEPATAAPASKPAAAAPAKSQESLDDLLKE